jgi:hypothetical protein
MHKLKWGRMISNVYSNMKKFKLIVAALITSTLLIGCTPFGCPPSKKHRGHKRHQHRMHMKHKVMRDVPMLRIERGLMRFQKGSKKLGVTEEQQKQETRRYRRGFKS